MGNYKYIGLIPARYGSSRFPGKPLCDINGFPMIWHVYNSAIKFSNFASVYVATDDKRIVGVCDSYNIPTIMTDNNHKDCLDRCAEASKILKNQNIEADRYIIIQGDEPLFDIRTLDVDLTPEIVNFYTNTRLYDEENDTNCVKVIKNINNKAIYYSRVSLPYDNINTRKDNRTKENFKQIGIYSFSYEKLQQYVELGVSYLEATEGIGLNRLIENNIDIHLRFTNYDSISVDTEKDRMKIIDMINKNHI